VYDNLGTTNLQFLQIPGASPSAASRASLAGVPPAVQLYDATYASGPGRRPGGSALACRVTSHVTSVYAVPCGGATGLDTRDALRILAPVLVAAPTLPGSAPCGGDRSCG
jgi:hypothetical protein